MARPLCLIIFLLHIPAIVMADANSFSGQATNEELQDCINVTVETSQTVYRIGEDVPLFVTIRYRCPRPRLVVFPGGQGHQHFRVNLAALDTPSDTKPVKYEAQFRQQERDGHLFDFNFFGSRDNFTYMPPGMTAEEARMGILAVTGSGLQRPPSDEQTSQSSSLWILSGDLDKSRYFAEVRTETLRLSEHYQVNSPGRYHLSVRVYFPSDPIVSVDSEPVAVRFTRNDVSSPE